MRIVTINTAKGDGAYGHRLRALADQLRELEPDVVALQEAFSACDGSAATASRLAAALRLHLSFAPARRKPRAVEGRTVLSDSGLAFLTRVPLLDQAVIALPWAPSDGERIAQIGVVRAADGPVLLVNLHLTHLPGASDLRRAQLDTILRQPHLRRPFTARIICGDFNATLRDPELVALASGKPGWDVRDAYTAGGGEPRATITPAVSLRPNPSPPRCIDYIFSLVETGANTLGDTRARSIGGESARHPSFRDSAIVLDRPDPETGIYPSDHLGVATTMVVGQTMENRGDGGMIRGQDDRAAVSV